VREYKFKKKSFAEVKKNANGIFFKVTIFFVIMIIMSFLFGLMGIKPD
jgi:hypothetical protein